MSILVDRLFKELNSDVNTQNEINGKWYIAKPYGLQICSISTFVEVMCERISDAIKILLGKALAYHYKEDET